VTYVPVAGIRYLRLMTSQVVDGVTKTVGTLGLSLAALKLGANLSSHVRTFVPRMRLAPRPIRYGITVFAIFIYAATLPAYFKLPASVKHQATAALLFSFPGTLTRYLLSIRLNPISKAIPIGTFTANMLGTGLLAAFHMLQNTSSPPVTENACALLQGLLDGFCGCLTTVSTFAAELASLTGRKAWRYAALSWILAQLLILVIQGPSFWSAGVNEQRKCHFA
jgi:fluoride exporter